MLEKTVSLLWGIPTLIIMLSAGLFITIKIKASQFKAKTIFNNTVKSLFKKDNAENGINQFQAVSVALAATMGTGNIIGVASAIAIGGAGSIFWMWISAIMGMALVYAENVLSIKFRRKEHGETIGGAFAYLKYGVKNKILAIFFAVCCVLTSFGMGCMAQSNSAALSLKSLGISTNISGIVIALCVGIIILGGVKRVGHFASLLVPFLSLAYIVVSLVIILTYKEKIPAVFAAIFKGAFGFNEVTGGFSGYILAQSINVGLRRGVFSNEAGLGTSALMHKDVNSENAELQGQWGIVEIFIDTILCCTLTALVLLCTGVSGTDTSNLVIDAFSTVLGDYAKVFISVSITLFAFATLISWGYCGAGAANFLGGKKASSFYKILFAVSIFIGAVGNAAKVWLLSDIFNILMLFPNLFGIIYLSKHLKAIRKN
ncbi:MAG: amino acid carrier protein [Oscillospiraceae bacterium]|jgi:AGCS family alanine or glycine:cation symporter|nr:amino acid carrier protein [Oscillospiraceae bacterium]